MVVDDEELVYKMVALWFEREGFFVLTADNGTKGLRLAIAEKPDVVLLDIMMPGPLGFTVSAICQQLNFRSLNAFFTSLSAGFLLSLAVELLLFDLPDRFSSAIDILSNTTGATIGFFLFQTHRVLPLRMMIEGSTASSLHST